MGGVDGRYRSEGKNLNGVSLRTSSGISEVVIASIMIIIIMNKLQEMTVFRDRQKLTSAMKLTPEK